MIGDEGYFLHRSLSKLMENRTSSPCSLLFSYLCPRRKPSEHKGSGKDVGKPWCFCGLGSFEVVRTTLVAAAKQEKRKMSSWCQKNLWAIPGPLKEASHGELGLRVIATMSSRWRQYNNNNDNRLIIYINDNVIVYNGIPWWLSSKKNLSRCRRHRFDPWVRKIPWRRNDNPLQYSCLGNPIDRGAWRATGSQSRTWLKWLNTIVY